QHKSKKTIFNGRPGGEHADGARLTRCRIPHFDRTCPFCNEDTAVGRDRELHRISDGGRQHDLLETRCERGGDISCSAPGCPLYSSEKMFEELRVLVGLGTMSQPGVPRAAPVILMRPCNGVIVSHLATRIAILAQGGEDVNPSPG